MRYNFNIDKWYYDINDIIQGRYGYELVIYHNNVEVYRQSGFGSIGNCKSYAEKYIIEKQFNIDLTTQED